MFYDDDPDIIELFEDACKKEGYGYKTTQRLNGVLEELKTSPFDIVIMDLRNRNKSSLWNQEFAKGHFEAYGLAEKIRELSDTPPVLVATSVLNGRSITGKNYLEEARAYFDKTVDKYSLLHPDFRSKGFPGLKKLVSDCGF